VNLSKAKPPGIPSACDKEQGFAIPQAFQKIPKSRRTSALACLVLLAAGFLYFWKNRHSPQEADGSADRAEISPRKAESARPNLIARSNENPMPPAIAANSVQSTAPQMEEVLEQIHDASVTYDPKELPKIQPFLTHENPEVRKAAVDGMVILGDASAGAMIREAAKSAPTPQEAVEMLEAADYVELPSARAVIRKKKTEE
jgi:hypothetical protein